MKRGMLLFDFLSFRLPRARLAFWSISSKHGAGHICTSYSIMQSHIYTTPAPPHSHPHQPPQPHPPPLPTIQLRPHIQIKSQPPAPPPIKINHILHPHPLTPLHHPIMPIKRTLVPPQPQPPRPRTDLRAIPAETPQHRPIARRVLPAREPPFPPLDLGPRALVDGVVDRHDGRHVRGVRVVVLAAHGVEEHLLRRVDPVRGRRRGVLMRWCRCQGRSRGVWGELGARDGACDAVGG